MIKAIKFVSIPVRDQQRALEFWTKQVGFEVSTDQDMGPGGRWVELQIPRSATRLVLMQTGGPLSPPGPDTLGRFQPLSFESDNVEKTYELLKSRGVEFLAPPKKMDWGTSVQFKDPDGNTFHLGSG